MVQPTMQDVLSGLQALATSLRTDGCGIAGLRRLSGGASQETWSFELQCASGTALPLVLRRAAGATPGAGGAGLVIEAQLLQLANEHGVAVPRVELVLRSEHGLGEGFVMQHVAGETLGRRIAAAPALAAARERLAWQCGHALARIHGIALQRLPTLRVAAAAAEMAHYEAQHRSHGTARPVFELALRWLKANDIGEPPRRSLVHGDFRNGNLVVGADGLRAVLDWELAHVGDPMEDLGWLCVNSWRYGHDELPVGGFGRREDLFDGYRAGGGTVDVRRVDYWQCLGSLKWGVMCESMAQAHLSGALRSIERAAIGRRASEAEIDLLELIA